MKVQLHLAGIILSRLNENDYVLATKYRDGDPQDEWAIGFFHSVLQEKCGDRFMVIDREGNQFRENGFRCAEKITPACGEWLLERVDLIERSGKSLWWWKWWYLQLA